MIHGISPEAVAQCPHIDSYTPRVNEILSNAKLIIGYNLDFDLSFIRRSGIAVPDGIKQFDVMKEFAEKANKTEIKGGIMDNAAIDVSVVEKLAATPSKEVLRTRLMWSITGSVRSLAIGLNAVKEKMEA